MDSPTRYRVSNSKELRAIRESHPVNRLTPSTGVQGEHDTTTRAVFSSDASRLIKGLIKRQVSLSRIGLEGFIK